MTPEPTVELVRALAAELRAGLRRGAVGRMIVPPRETAEDGAGTKFISMPAVSPDYDLYINKVATIVAPDTPGRGATVTSVVPMFAVSTGRFLGLADGTAVTNLKCAAVTALVTESCAATGAAVLGIIGSGVQARQQYLGVAAVRDLAQVRIFSRDPAHAAAFGREVTALAGPGVDVVVSDSAARASRDVDILITATTSAEPLPISPDLPGHVHVNCVGAHTVASRELSQELLRTSVLIVEDRPTAVAEAGPLHERAVELDALDTPAAAGFGGQRTVFSSTGCAYLDLITCAHLLTLDRARDDETEPTSTRSARLVATPASPASARLRCTGGDAVFKVAKSKVGAMFADDNRAFVARQHDEPGYAVAARGADQLLDDLGVSYRSLPYYFRTDAATQAELARATKVLVRAQDKLLAHLTATRSAAELTAMFEVPAPMAAHIDWPTVASAGLRMLRADIIPTDTGYYFCELNHFPGVGAGESYHSTHAFAELLNRPVAGVSPFRHLAALYVTQARRAGLTRVVILDTPQHRAQGYGASVMLKRYLRLMAPDLTCAYLDEVTYPPGWLHPDEAERTLLHRIVTYDDTPDAGAFLVRLRDLGATVSGMFESELKMHRRWFSLLCDPGYQQLLDADELATVARYVPHTFDLHPGTIDAAVADKDELVFKRSYTYGGQGVLVGAEHGAEKLHAQLTADSSAWVAQRRVPTSQLELRGADGEAAPFRLVLGMFVYGDAASGLLVRASARSQVVNVSSGGGGSWAFAE